MWGGIPQGFPPHSNDAPPALHAGHVPIRSERAFLVPSGLGAQPKNGEEAALARVGRVLYQKIFKEYTVKQWDKVPSQLAASVLNRIPVRDDWNDRCDDRRHGCVQTRAIAN